MRTTISIQDSLLEQAKQMALQRKCTLGHVVEDALRRSLSQKISKDINADLKLTTFKGEGLATSANLDSHSELLDAMEER